MTETEQTTEVHEATTQADGTQVERHNVSRTSTTSGIVLAQRVIWFIVGVIDVFLAIRFVLLLLGANQGAGFVDFIYGLTGIFVAPFVGIFGAPTYGQYMFEWSSLLAVIVYTLVAWGIVKLITLARPQEEI